MLIGTVTLNASAPSYLLIKPNTCVLHVVGEKGSPSYTINQGVDIDQNEIIEGSCAVQRKGSGTITVTPSFVTYQRTIFGERVIDSKDVQKTVTFTSNETKEVSFIVPKASAPQAYDAVLSLVPSNGIAISNNVPVHYVLRGPSATIQNVLIDKDYYAAGDSANVSVYWTGSADSFIGARKASSHNTASNLLISITDGGNNKCAKDATFTVPSDEIERNTLTSHAVSITHFCTDPRVTATIVDESDSALAQETVAFTSGQVSSGSWFMSSFKERPILYILMGFIILIVSGALVVKGRKANIL